MDEAIAFLQEFTKREYEALLSRAGDPDPVFKEKLAVRQSFVATVSGGKERQAF